MAPLIVKNRSSSATAAESSACAATSSALDVDDRPRSVARVSHRTGRDVMIGAGFQAVLRQGSRPRILA